MIALNEEKIRSIIQDEIVARQHKNNRLNEDDAVQVAEETIEGTNVTPSEIRLLQFAYQLPTTGRLVKNPKDHTELGIYEQFGPGGQARAFVSANYYIPPSLKHLMPTIDDVFNGFDVGSSYPAMRLGYFGGGMGEFKERFGAGVDQDLSGMGFSNIQEQILGLKNFQSAGFRPHETSYVRDPSTMQALTWGQVNRKFGITIPGGQSSEEYPKLRDLYDATVDVEQGSTTSDEAGIKVLELAVGKEASAVWRGVVSPPTLEAPIPGGNYSKDFTWYNYEDQNLSGEIAGSGFPVVEKVALDAMASGGIQDALDLGITANDLREVQSALTWLSGVNRIAYGKVGKIDASLRTKLRDLGVDMGTLSYVRAPGGSSGRKPAVYREGTIFKDACQYVLSAYRTSEGDPLDSVVKAAGPGVGFIADPWSGPKAVSKKSLLKLISTLSSLGYGFTGGDAPVIDVDIVTDPSWRWASEQVRAAVSEMGPSSVEREAGEVAGAGDWYFENKKEKSIRNLTRAIIKEFNFSGAGSEGESKKEKKARKAGDSAAGQTGGEAKTSGPSVGVIQRIIFPDEPEMWDDDWGDNTQRGVDRWLNLHLRSILGGVTLLPSNRHSLSEPPISGSERKSGTWDTEGYIIASEMMDKEPSYSRTITGLATFIRDVSLASGGGKTLARTKRRRPAEAYTGSSLNVTIRGESKELSRLTPEDIALLKEGVRAAVLENLNIAEAIRAKNWEVIIVPQGGSKVSISASPDDILLPKEGWFGKTGATQLQAHFKLLSLAAGQIHIHVTPRVVSR